MLLSSLYLIFNSLKDKGRKVVIMGKELHTIVNLCIKNGYLEVDESMLGNLTDLKNPNTVILISNDRETPYYNLSRIVNGYDKYITLESTDSICFADPSYEAEELHSVKIKNEIAEV